MTEVLFYHLEKRSLDDVLPSLVERTLGKGQRALIQAESAERAAAIDTLLWTYNDQSFLPHAQLGDGDAARQPALIAVEESNANNAEVLFLVGGAKPSSWAGPPLKDFARAVMLFDGRDTEALDSARTAWREAKSAGHDVTYWKEQPSGKFEKQA
jgi:DNA polymerase III subunit chi